MERKNSMAEGKSKKTGWWEEIDWKKFNLLENSDEWKANGVEHKILKKKVNLVHMKRKTNENIGIWKKKK